ncbi:hypothetical protein [Ornithinimicrobium avium]|uniref:Uncharacterized protein n=1 Tax=Ornithinimicrobium avium TaxID=2283195 RepID=A0A345NKA0_9MICO|nr:hypothetical protein [Ornithinimicrobium avium]AXH95458.1 hypothetical protein DV701_04330 [Ornithinimicrobium avium]
MSRGSACARTILRRAALERAPHLGARGTGMKLSHLVDHVGCVALGARATGSAESVLVALTPTITDLMVEADGMARRVMSAVRDAVDDSVRDSELSVFVATACAASLRTEQRLPLAEEEQQLVARLTARVLESRARGQAWDPETFATAAGPRFRAAWLAAGARHLTEWPPSQIGLGHDERPPLLTAPARGPRTWVQGSDRSVYSRYALFFDPRARRRSGNGQRHDCPQDRRGHARPDPVALAVDVACETYGLEHEGHRGLLRTLASHVDGPASSHGPRVRLRFVDWDEECRPLPTTDGPAQEALTERFLELQASWWRSVPARQLLDRWGDPSCYLHLVGPLLVRRAWQTLLGRERELADPAGTCAVDGLVGTALTKGVGTELSALLRGERGLPPAPSLQRTQATLQLLAATSSTRGDVPTAEEVMSHYDVLLAERGTAGEHEFLNRQELADLIVRAGQWRTAAKQDEPSEEAP